MERAHKKAVIAAKEEDAVISIRDFLEGQTAGNDTNEEDEEEATAVAAATKPRRLISRSRFFFLSRFSLSLSFSLSLPPRGVDEGKQPPSRRSPPTSARYKLAWCWPIAITKRRESRCPIGPSRADIRDDGENRMERWKYTLPPASLADSAENGSHLVDADSNWRCPVHGSVVSFSLVSSSGRNVRRARRVTNE